MWGPQTLCECWFINPIRILVRYLRIINHSEIGVINAPTERNFVSGSPLYIYVYNQFIDEITGKWGLGNFKYI